MSAPDRVIASAGLRVQIDEDYRADGLFVGEAYVVSVQVGHIRLHLATDGEPVVIELRYRRSSAKGEDGASGSNDSSWMG